VEKASYESYFGQAIENVLAYAAGKPANVINPEALGKK
jgi:D-3-phosphoglycerate dehydrogenase